MNNLKEFQSRGKNIPLMSVVTIHPYQTSFKKISKELQIVHLTVEWRKKINHASLEAL